VDVVLLAHADMVLAHPEMVLAHVDMVLAHNGGGRHDAALASVAVTLIVGAFFLASRMSRNADRERRLHERRAGQDGQGPAGGSA